MLIIANPRTRTIRGVVIAASALVAVAMWIERYFIVVASLRIPLMEYEPSDYAPTWVEVSITAGAFALFGLVILLFLRFIPIVSMWEQAEQHEIDEARSGAEAPATAARTTTGTLAPGPETAGGGS